MKGLTSALMRSLPFFGVVILVSLQIHNDHSGWLAFLGGAMIGLGSSVGWRTSDE